MDSNIRFNLAIILMVITGIQASAQPIATLRGEVPLDQESDAPVMTSVNVKEQRMERNYPMQPPVIPHNIRGYQVDLYANKCLSCHNRTKIQESQAPMISVTHFMDRDGNFLAEVSPRRYFCNQCHVTQNEVKVPIDNEFVDIESLLKTKGDR